MTTTTRLSAAAVLSAALCAACSSSTGGTAGDGGRPADGSNGSGADAATATDGESSSHDAGLADGASIIDGTSPASPEPVSLGTAGLYAILAQSAISTVPASAVTGNMGISPAAASYITGFSLVADATNVFSISPQVTGKIYASDYAAPTPASLTSAVNDMGLAFTDAAGRAAGVTDLGAGNIGGMTLTAGVYEWGTGLLIPTTVTLSGSSTDVWIFQVAQDLTVSNGANVVLAGGALAKNVVWQVAGAAVLGTTAQFEGIILSMTSISLQTGATITGRLLAQTAVSIDGSVVVEPAP